MKLNYSTSPVTFVYIHIILIHIIFIHISTATTTEASDDNDNEDANYYEIPDENKKIIIEQVKANLLKVLGLKEVPRKPQNKAYVPHAMLEEYRKVRDSVRDTIPEDRDFYGKINIDDLDANHEDFWSAVYNKYGGYDIEVDMGRDDEEEAKRFHYKGDATQIAYVGPQSEPEDVPPAIEHLLPPHARSTQSQKQFISVHLRFNLSQELFTRPMAADELRGAELHLSRERLLDCEFNDCDRKPVPFFSRDKSSNKQTREQETKVEDVASSGSITSTSGSSSSTSTTTSTESSSSGSSSEDNEKTDSSLTTNKLRNKPRYQRVYVLHIFSYDKHNEPITRIHDSQRIDTQQTTPLVFDIYGIIKYWLMNPTDNYGIIVRVTNDDKEYEQNTKQQITSSAINLKDSTNASSHNVYKQPQTVGIEEHVRLKREFRFASESNETWLEKQPSILIYSGSPDAARHHVKRDYLSGELDHNMQADDPEANTSDNPVQPNQTTEDSSQSNDSQTQINKPTVASSTTTPTRQPRPSNGNHPMSRRDSSRPNNGANQYNRNIGVRSSTSASTASSSQNQRAKSKPRSPRPIEKCGRKTLSINFDEVGWSSWIIAPNSYFANYCFGDCSYPLSDAQNATNHAIIQSIFRSVGKVVPRLCCAPTKLGRMAILYQLDGVVQMRHYDDMIVESCGCL